MAQPDDIVRTDYGLTGRLVRLIHRPGLPTRAEVEVAPGVTATTYADMLQVVKCGHQEQRSLFEEPPPTHAQG